MLASLAWLLAPSLEAAGLRLYSDYNYTGTASSEFSGPSGTTTINKYSTAAMVSRNAANNSASSASLSPGYLAQLFDGDNQTGGQLNLSASAPNMGGNNFNDKTSSLMVWRKAAGRTVLSSSGGLEPYQPGYIFGTWIFMHRDDWAIFASSGGESHYTVRYEVEYWQGSGAILGPLVQTQSGTNVRVTTAGVCNMGTCTGSAPAQEEYWRLNGQVKWTNREGYSGYNCRYNIAVRDEW
jgi:hypothetical protein